MLLKTKHTKYHNKPEFYLQQAALSLNSKCNANCKYCCGRITSDPDMPLSKVKEVMHTLIAEMNIEDIYPTCSAELTLYKDLIPLIEYVDSINTPYLKITQDTNGRHIPDNFIETLNNVDVYWTISVSCWGYDSASWQEYQGKGDFDKFVANIKRYITELKIAPSFSLVSITDEQIKKTIAFIQDICKECGHDTIIMDEARSIYLRPLKEKGIIPIVIRTYRYPDETNGETQIHCKGNPTNVRVKLQMNNCDMVYKSVIMDSLGYIYPCLELNGRSDYAIGNVNDYSPFNKDALLEMMHSDKGIAYWRDNVTCDKFSCDQCTICTTRCSY